MFSRKSFSSKSFSSKSFKGLLSDAILAIGAYVVRLVAPVLELITQPVRKVIEENNIAIARLESFTEVEDNTPESNISNITPTFTVRDIT